MAFMSSYSFARTTIVVLHMQPCLPCQSLPYSISERKWRQNRSLRVFVNIENGYKETCMSLEQQEVNCGWCTVDLFRLNSVLAFRMIP
jgi:hypothetical protein